MDELAKQFADLAGKYSSSVIEASLSAVRVEMISQLVAATLCFIAAGGFVLFGRFLWRRSAAIQAGGATRYETEFPDVLGYLAFIGAVILIVIGAWHWIDPWTWTALRHPELWLAKRALHL